MIRADQVTLAFYATRTQLRDITGIEAVPRTIEEPNLSWLWVAFTGLVAAIFLLAIIRRRWVRIAVAPKPHVRALASLALLNGQMNSGILHEKIADTLRGYLHERFNVPASQLTSQELLESMNATPCSSIEMKKLAVLMERCDSAKFAALEFSANECRQTVSLAREFIMTTA